MKPLSYFLALLAMLGLAAGVAASADPHIPSFNARYDLKKGPLTLGVARVEYRRLPEQRYTYRMHTRATGLARLIIGGYTEERSEGLITGDGFQPTAYRYQRAGGDNPRQSEARFDRAAGRVEGVKRGKPWALEAPQGVLDRVVGPLQLMHDLAAGRDELRYSIAERGKLRRYTVTREGVEPLDTALGRLDTVKVVRRREGGGEVTTLWCAPALNYLAVRVEHEDDEDGTFSLELTRLAGMDLAGR